MILRRVIEHFRKQEWTAIAIDFVIVVLGVFIGLQVQDWSRNTSDRQRESELIGGLIADLEIDRAQYAQGLAAAEKRVRAAAASLEGAGLQSIEFDPGVSGDLIADYSIDLSTAEDIQPDRRSDRLWTNIVIGFHPTPSTLTYDAIAGSGDVGLIRDGEMVREIQRYYNLVSSVGDQNRKVMAIREDALMVGTAYGLAPFASMPADDYFRLVASEPQLAATIRIMATFVIYHRGDIAAADTQATELQQNLKDYLESLK